MTKPKSARIAEELLIALDAFATQGAHEQSEFENGEN